MGKQQDFMETKLEQLVEALEKGEPTYIQKTDRWGDVHEEYSPEATLDDAVANVFSKKELAEQYDWDARNIVAHYEPGYGPNSQPKIVINQWFYDPDTGQKETGRVDEIAINKQQIGRIAEALQKEYSKEISGMLTNASTQLFGARHTTGRSAMNQTFTMQHN